MDKSSVDSLKMKCCVLLFFIQHSLRICLIFLVSRAIGYIMSTLFYPIITFFLLAICIAYWAVIAVYPSVCWYIDELFYPEKQGNSATFMQSVVALLQKQYIKFVNIIHNIIYRNLSVNRSCNTVVDIVTDSGQCFFYLLFHVFKNKSKMETSWFCCVLCLGFIETQHCNAWRDDFSISIKSKAIFYQ